MKTIKVSDEMYDFLMNLSNEIKTQDNRCTAMPYFFQVREKKEVAAHEGSGTEVLYSSEYEVELRTEQNKRQWIKEHFDYFDESMWYEELKEIDIVNEWTLDAALMDLDFNRFYVDEDYEYSNVFFTSKACDEYIKLNRHNLKSPDNYLKHAFRNREMEMIFKFITELNGGKLHK